MKTKILSIIVFTGFILTSCSKAIQESATREVNGTITVSDPAYFNDLKIGVTASEGSWLTDHLYFNSASRSILYFDQNDGFKRGYSMEATAVLTNGANANTKNFTLTLPEISSADDDFYLVAWIDSDQDGKLDLKDTLTSAGPHPNSEYNQTCTVTLDGEESLLREIGASSAIITDDIVYFMNATGLTSGTAYAHMLEDDNNNTFTFNLTTDTFQ